MIKRQDAKTPGREEPGAELDSLAAQVVDAAFNVHANLGPGLLENVYEVCLAHELRKRGLTFERQVALPAVYDGLRIEGGLRMDLIVGDQLVVEVKAVETLLPLHKVQLMTYLKLSGHTLGLLINFNVPLIKDGIKRIICSPLAPWRPGALSS
jgi:GxxExxY protein